jgi:rsbT co-antagonist protein RsbR
MKKHETLVADILRKHEAPILEEWLEQQSRGGGSAKLPAELRQQASTLLSLFSRAVQKGGFDASTVHWDEVKNYLVSLSETRGRQGFTPGETATFVFSLKQPVFTQLRRSLEDQESIADISWSISTLIDHLGLLTTDAALKTREEFITRQQQELMELSTPVVRLWDGILALPLIGTLDSARTQVVMESLLQQIVNTGAQIAIIDITGVPTVDTLVAQHLLKTVAAARLMGADCIISGIRPQIAQTIVHLGVELNTVATKATLADAFAVALKKLGLSVGPAIRG